MNGKKYEHQLTTCLNRVIRTAHDVQDILVVMESNETEGAKDQKMEMLTVRAGELPANGKLCCF